MPEIDCKETLTFTSEHVKGKLALLVESLIIDYILMNRENILKIVYPEQSGGISSRWLMPHPNSTGEVGLLKRAGGKNRDAKYFKNVYKVSKWYGDFGMVLNDKEHGKRAVIFEIKHGRVCISTGQHKFFQEIKANPNKFMDNLKEVTIIIARGYNLDLENNTLDIQWMEYHETQNHDDYVNGREAVR
jgi:hypothetical protein